MLYSQVRGYNNRSGVLYNEINGLRQFRSKNILYPRSENATAMYENTRNTELLLSSMNDGKSFFNKGGMSKFPDLPNRDLSDERFKNKGNVKTQTKEKNPINKLVISKEAKILAKKSVRNLPINKTTESTAQQKTLNKFNSFLNSLKKIPNAKNATSNLSKEYPE
jgi:hypothetical protein